MSMLRKHPVTNEGNRVKHVSNDETDVNRIVARFERTGQLPPPNREGQFMDCSGIGDYREQYQKVHDLQVQYQAQFKKLKEMEAESDRIEKAKAAVIPPVVKEKEVKS